MAEPLPKVVAESLPNVVAEPVPKVVLVVALGVACLAACDGSRSLPDAESTDTPTDATDGAHADTMDSATDDANLGRDGSGDADSGPAPRPISRLRADGTAIVDADGVPVQLRGVNLGGWLFHETWITGVDYPVWGRAWLLAEEAGFGDEAELAIVELGPGDDEDWVAAFRAAMSDAVGADAAAALADELEQYPSLWDDSDLPLRRELEARFGVDGRDELLGIFQDAWITERDIAWLSDAGFNLVRIPIGYRNLLTNSENETLTELQWNEPALQRLDALLDACEEHRVWAVVDLQESPGGHNSYSGEARLYGDATFEALTRELWGHLAARYRGRDVVAMYSLLAEPFSAPSESERDRVYSDLIDVIRGAGDDHLVVVHDGFFGMDTLPDPAARGWTNVVYSTHLFEWTLDSLFGWEVFVRAFEPRYDADQVAQGVPWFIGSFSTMRDEEWAYDAARMLVDWYESRGWAWSIWTYRRIDDPLETALFGTTTSWGVVGRLASPFDRPDVYRDDFATLSTRLSAYATLPIGANEALVNALVGPR